MSTMPAAANVRAPAAADYGSAAVTPKGVVPRQAHLALVVSSYLLALAIPVFGFMIAASDVRHGGHAIGLALTSIVALAGYVVLLSVAGA